MSERYYTESPDPLEDDWKQNRLDFIRKDLEGIFTYGFSGDSQTEDLENTTVEDVNDFIYDSLIPNGIIKTSFVNTVVINEPKEVIELCDYMSTTLPEYPQEGNVQVHFLESNDFAATVSVIQTGSTSVSVKVQPLEDCPEFLVKKWKEIIDGNSLKDEKKSKADMFKTLKKKLGKNI